MKVKTLKKHANQHGDKYQKAPGKIYDHPSPESDIANRIVAEVKPTKSAKATKKRTPAKKASE